MCVQYESAVVKLPMQIKTNWTHSTRVFLSIKTIDDCVYPMAHASYWSRRSSNETATSDTLTNFLNLSTSSQGRSCSSGSLPFAEDVIRQNKQDWEHVERIFYGEEPLPEDDKTREEFTDWMNNFPHLRVVGKPVNTARFRRTNGNPPILYEEYIVLDPPGRTTLSRRTEEMSGGLISSRSGQILSRRYNNCCCDELMQSSSISTLTPRNKVSTDKNESIMTARLGGGGGWTSANLLRLPSVGGNTKCTLEAIRPSPLKSTVTLPLLSVGKLTFGDLLTTRSISALHKPVVMDETAMRSKKIDRR